ncbi:MAG: peptidylprolyl isomerase [Sinimarinibacterium flocculans]|uniref:Chaperone SurA n=1 Tax=Sinimarinibacterium flocculans TaxID=985250 RepID=A0A318EHW7_9GAMM|nr:peptidylprolyl isomerase [Sinimarinibacterium flocculans]MEC9363982.1 peptidylprolyl isomerase [Pseudomonadota bacterium]PXV70226.1 periplasmic chaperone for outer membrane proteins SurA [Sinimarinibacterium flocculans]
MTSNPASALFLRRLAAPLLIAMTAALAPAQAATPIDRILVVVNDGVILQSELNAAMREAGRQIQTRGIAAPDTDVLRAQVLERLILTRIQTQRAESAGIRVDDRELNEVLTNLARQNDMTLAQFAEAVRADGMDYLLLREQIRQEVMIQRVRAREVDSRVVVTDQDVNMLLATQGPDPDVEYRLSHILVAVPEGASADVRDAARKKAEGLLQRIRGGEAFAEIAIAHSDGQQALQGGDLEWRRADALPQLFALTAADLAPGETSDVIEASGGFHIVQLADIRGGPERKTVDETRARHVLIQTNAVRDDEQARLLARDIYNRLEAGEDFAKLAKEYSDDPGSKNSGGDLGFQPPGVFAPEFQVRIDQLQPGELSPPFRTQFGWHVAGVLERRTRDTTEETRRARARNAIGSRKSAEEYEIWLRRLRSEAYIEYRLPDDAEAARST